MNDRDRLIRRLNDWGIAEAEPLADYLMVNRKCKYFNNPEACQMIQKECNCYQCPIVEWELNKKDLSLLQNKISKLEKENHDLKILLAEKVLKEREGK